MMYVNMIFRRQDYKAALTRAAAAVKDVRHADAVNGVIKPILAPKMANALQPLWATTLVVLALTPGAGYADEIINERFVLCDGSTHVISARGSTELRPVSGDTSLGGYTVNIRYGYPDDSFAYSGEDTGTFVFTAGSINGTKTLPDFVTHASVDIAAEHDPGDQAMQVTCTRPVAGAPAAPGTPPTTPTTPAVTTAAATSVSAQADATQTALNTNIAGRFDNGAGVSASGSNLTVSSRGLDQGIDQLGEPELNAWVSVDARRFSGGQTGNVRGITLGLDRLLQPDLLVGGFVGISDSALTPTGSTTDVQTNAPIFGLYGAKKFNDGLFLSGFVAHGRPKYSVGATAFAARRTMGGLTLQGETAVSVLRIMPSASVLTTLEDIPTSAAGAADKLRSTNAKLAVRAEPKARMKNGLLPYFSLAAEYGAQNSNLSASSTFTKPRIGLGADWKLAAGTLRIDFDYGSVSDATTAIGASLTYDFRF